MGTSFRAYDLHRISMLTCFCNRVLVNSDRSAALEQPRWCSSYGTISSGGRRSVRYASQCRLDHEGTHPISQDQSSRAGPVGEEPQVPEEARRRSGTRASGANPGNPNSARRRGLRTTVLADSPLLACICSSVLRTFASGDQSCCSGWSCARRCGCATAGD